MYLSSSYFPGMGMGMGGVPTYLSPHSPYAVFGAYPGAPHPPSAMVGSAPTLTAPTHSAPTLTAVPVAYAPVPPYLPPVVSTPASSALSPCPGQESTLPSKSTTYLGRSSSLSSSSSYSGILSQSSSDKTNNNVGTLGDVDNTGHSVVSPSSAAASVDGTSLTSALSGSGSVVGRKSGAYSAVTSSSATAKLPPREPQPTASLAPTVTAVAVSPAPIVPSQPSAVPPTHQPSTSAQDSVVHPGSKPPAESASVGARSFASTTAIPAAFASAGPSSGPPPSASPPVSVKIDPLGNKLSPAPTTTNTEGSSGQLTSLSSATVRVVPSASTEATASSSTPPVQLRKFSPAKQPATSQSSPPPIALNATSAGAAATGSPAALKQFSSSTAAMEPRAQAQPFQQPPMTQSHPQPPPPARSHSHTSPRVREREGATSGSPAATSKLTPRQHARSSHKQPSTSAANPPPPQQAVTMPAQPTSASTLIAETLTKPLETVVNNANTPTAAPGSSVSQIPIPSVALQNRVASRRLSAGLATSSGANTLSQAAICNTLPPGTCPVPATIGIASHVKKAAPAAPNTSQLKSRIPVLSSKWFTKMSLQNSGRTVDRMDSFGNIAAPGRLPPSLQSHQLGASSTPKLERQDSPHHGSNRRSPDSELATLRKQLTDSRSANKRLSDQLHVSRKELDRLRRQAREYQDEIAQLIYLNPHGSSSSDNLEGYNNNEEANENDNEEEEEEEDPGNYPVHRRKGSRVMRPMEVVIEPLPQRGQRAHAQAQAQAQAQPNRVASRSTPPPPDRQAIPTSNVGAERVPRAGSGAAAGRDRNFSPDPAKPVRVSGGNPLHTSSHSAMGSSGLGRGRTISPASRTQQQQQQQKMAGYAGVSPVPVPASFQQYPQQQLQQHQHQHQHQQQMFAVSGGGGGSRTESMPQGIAPRAAAGSRRVG